MTSTSDPRAGESWKELGNALPSPRDPADSEDLLWQEFVAHFRWYDRAATRSRLGHLSLRLVVLIVGAAVTVCAAVGAAPLLTASLAAVIVAAEGSQQLFQFHTNWISYRSTAETLRENAFLYAAQVDPYDLPDRRTTLARVMREATSKESAVWAGSMRGSVPDRQPAATSGG